MFPICQILLQFVSQLSCFFFVSQSLNQMPPSSESFIFDDVMITLAILSDKQSSKVNFCTIMLKRIIRIICVKNGKNVF